MDRRIAFAMAFAGSLLGSRPAIADESGLVTHRDWLKSPEAVFLLTAAEAKEWRKVETDAEAESFIALFWARRDPIPETKRNEFKERFDALVKLADQHFKLSTSRGALTERGRLYILVGPPKTISIAAGTKAHASGRSASPDSGLPAENDPGTTLGENVTTFTYESKQLPEWAGPKSLVANFAVEQTRDSLLGPEDVRRMEALASRVALKRPELVAIPDGADSQFPVTVGGRTGGVAPAPRVSSAANAALEAAVVKAPFGALTALLLGSRDGGARLTIQVYLEVSGTPPPVRAAWLVRGKDGRDAARGEEQAEPRSALKGVVVDRAISLPRGEYDVAFVLLDATGAVVHAARRSVALAPASPELAASPLVLAIADLPADDAGPDAPFVVARRRFVSRGSGRILMSDGLCYLVRLYGPGVDSATKKAFVRRKISIQPRGGSPIELPAAPDEPVSISEVAAGGLAVLDMAGTVADNNIGEYFKPGDYTFRVILEDVVRKTRLEVSEELTIVARDK